jgi:hypothetical protein
MTRLELLKIIIGRARANGFEFRRWYTARLGLPWINNEASLACLDQQRRYYALLFSHDFAIAFWKPGSEITFQVPAQTFQRRMPDGTVQTVTRKSFIRRSLRRDAWRYHLREMALAEEPLRYIRRYLHVEDELIDEPATTSTESQERQDRQDRTEAASEPPAERSHAPGSSHAPGRKRPAKPHRPLPDELPAFLRRPYP